MRLAGYLGLALIVATAVGGQASAANICRAEKLTCATTMPIDGYCECTSHGVTQSGTVVAQAPRHPVNSTAAGCGAHLNHPGGR